MALTGNYAALNWRLMAHLAQGTVYVVDNMRNNANQHLTWLSGTLDGSPGNPTLAQIAQFMNDCAASYTSIFATVTTFAQNNSAAVSAALNVWGITLAAANTELTALKAAATALAAADKTTVANAQAACNALLAAVPAVPGIQF